MKNILKLFITVLVLSCTLNISMACTRITYTTNSGTVVTGRTMDWQSEDNPQLRISTRGEKRKSHSSLSPIEWSVKYGNVAVISQRKLTNSGMNEKGLSADVLWLEASDYGNVKKHEKTIDIGAYIQYLLDNFATVDEVVKFVKNGGFRPYSSTKDTSGGFRLTLHFIVTDKTGNNAIIEYIDGESKIYEQKGRIVLANDPTYDKMLAIKNYYEEVGILRNMPGSALSQARFVYATGWLNELTENELDGYKNGISNHNFDTQAVMSVLSIMRGVSTPLGVEFTKSEPNNTSTLWRTVGDVKNNKFYFDSALTMTTIWADLNKIDFSKHYKSIELGDGNVLNGDIISVLEVIK